MLVYLHVPFCRKRCNYCAFYSNALPAPSATVGAGAAGGKGDAVAPELKAYLKFLLQEIALWGERLGPVKVESIFFGGGTPSLLPLDMIKKILAALGKQFTLLPGAEISLEANPESLLAFGYAEGLVKAGINRLSIGVQSLNDVDLQMLGRPHNAREAVAAFETARISGFKNINLDLIWGLPGQRPAQWLEQLKRVLELNPQHLSCYALTLEEGSPLHRLEAEGKIELPPEKDQAAMYAYGTELLESRGFIHYEISNFARMGFKCRHNLGYWEGQDYLGFGPSAVSTLGRLRWTNPADLPQWAAEVTAKECGKNPEERDAITQALEFIMLRLRTDRGLGLKAYKELTGRDFMKDNKKLVEGLHARGLVRLAKGQISLTNEGMLVSNSILEHLFAETEKRLRVKKSAS